MLKSPLVFMCFFLIGCYRNSIYRSQPSNIVYAPPILAADGESQYMNTPEMQHLMAEQQRLSQADPHADQRSLSRQMVQWGSDSSGLSPMQAYGKAHLDAMDKAQKDQTSREERSQAIAEAIQALRMKHAEITQE